MTGAAPAPLSSYRYENLTTTPEQVPVAAQQPLPALREPTTLPAVAADAAGNLEPLVAVTGNRLVTLDAYRRAGWPHSIESALVRAGTLHRLQAAADTLPDRFGLAAFDAWRPLALQRAIHTAAYADSSLPAGFVAEPATPPPHLTGGTVDVTLTYDGVPLALGTEFDAFCAAAHTAAFETTPGPVRELRRLLYHSMAAAGFVVIDCEWWHFEHGTRRWAAVCGTTPLYGPAAP